MSGRPPPEPPADQRTFQDWQVFLYCMVAGFVGALLLNLVGTPEALIIMFTSFCYLLSLGLGIKVLWRQLPHRHMNGLAIGICMVLIATLGLVAMVIQS